MHDDNAIHESRSDFQSENTLVTRQVELAKLNTNVHQPRKTFDDQAIGDLARSIEWHGLLQPISVQPSLGGDGFVIIAGERRVRAYKKLGRSHIEAVVVDGNPAELALIENLQREDLHPIDLAEGLAKLQAEFHYTDDDLAEVLGKSRPTINEILRINTLPDTIKKECRNSNNVSKSALLQVARANNLKQQELLWQAVRSSETIRSIKSKRSKIDTEQSGVVDAYKALVATERKLLRKFNEMPTDWKLSCASHCHEFVTLRQKLTMAIDEYNGCFEGEDQKKHASADLP